MPPLIPTIDREIFWVGFVEEKNGEEWWWSHEIPIGRTLGNQVFVGSFNGGGCVHERESWRCYRV